MRLGGAAVPVHPVHSVWVLISCCTTVKCAGLPLKAGKAELGGETYRQNAFAPRTAALNPVVLYSVPTREIHSSMDWAAQAVWIKSQF